MRQRFELDLYVRGKQLDPTALTALLGLTPSQTRTRGERKLTRSGRPVTTQVSVWHLKVEGASPSACVRALAGRFGGRIPDLSRLPGADEAFLDMFVTFEPGVDVGTEVLVEWRPPALEQLAACELPLRITFAVVGVA